MAASRHNLTRRAMLGAGAAASLALARGGQDAAAAAGPAAASGPGAPAAPVLPAAPSPASRGRWERALAAYRRAEARLAAFRRQIEALPPEQRAFPACEPFEDRFDDLESARLAALRRLLRAPAPDLPALALKIERTVDDQAWELTAAAPCLAALKADAHRLGRSGGPPNATA